MDDFDARYRQHFESCQKVDEQQVERQLKAYSDSNKRSIRHWLIVVCSKISPFHMEEPTRDGTMICFQFHNPFKWSARNCDTWTFRLAAVFCLLPTLLCAAYGCCHLYHDMILDAGTLNVVDGALKTSHNCALKNDTYRKDDRLFQQLLMIEWIEQQLGNPLRYLNGASEFATLTIVSLYVSLAIICAVSWNNQIEFPSSSYHYNPLGVRERFRRELNAFIVGLNVQSINYNLSIKSYANTSCQYNLEGQQSFIDQETRSFQLVLGSIKPEQIINKFIFSISSYKSIDKLYMFLTKHAIIPFTLQASFGYPILLIFGEAYLRATTRLAQLDCEKWNTNAIYLAQQQTPIDFNQDSDKKLRFAYSAHDNSWRNLLRLVLFIEVPDIMQHKQSVVSIMIILLVAIGFIWQSHYVALWAIEYFSSLRLTNKLKGELEVCIELLQMHRNLQQLATDDTNNNERRQCKLDLAISLTYIKFEFFRRNQRNFQQLSDNVASHIMLTVGSLVYLGQLIGGTINSPLKPLMLVSTITFLLIDELFLVLCARLTDNISQVYSSIARLLACSTECQMTLRPSIDLWRRQQLDLQQIVGQFAPTVFGYEISKENLISLNVYAIGAWMVLIK